MKTRTMITVLLAAATLSLTAGCEGVEAETPYETTQHALRGDDPTETPSLTYFNPSNREFIQALDSPYVAAPEAPAELNGSLLTWEEENPPPLASETVPQYEAVDPSVVRTEQDWYAPTPLEDGVVRTQEDWYAN
jgi:hypothetical protein